ncbi:MAG: type I methionyl aminopeptidase [Nitrospinae bacterium]|nr:type I methionyl aminopeptidase [Nitrospinota bacterium]
MIILKSPEEIGKIRAADRIVAKTLIALKEMVKPGMTTLELDRAAEEMVRAEGARPTFKGYRGFPAALCVSVNSEVVHGIPGKKKLKEGDIVSLDLGADLDGYFGDAAITVGVGEISSHAQRLMDVTRESLYKGIEQAKEGNRLSDISHAIQTHVEAAGFSVVTDFVGHGIGTQQHEDPQIPNYGPKGVGPLLKRGMVLAIEPMVNAGGHQVKVLDDGWTVVTRDGGLSAHFEHSIAVMPEKADILSEYAER